MMEELIATAAKILAEFLKSLPYWISVPAMGLGVIYYGVRQEKLHAARREAEKEETHTALLKGISGNVGKVLTIVEENKGDLAILKDRGLR